MLMENDVQHDELVYDTRPSPTDAMRLAMATQLLDNMQVQIRVADDKVRGLFGATALLAAAVSINTQQQFSQRLSGGWSLLTIAELVVRILLLVIVASAAASAVLALMPRVRGHRAERSLFFFDHIADTPHDTFINEFRTLTEADAAQQILSQVHVNARIVRAKYVWAGRAATGFLMAIVLWIVVQIITFLS